MGVLSSTAVLPVDPAGRASVPAWADPDSNPAPVAPCTRPVRNLVVQGALASVPVWALGPASASVPDLALAPVWADLVSRRPRVKRRGPSAPALQEDVAASSTPKRRKAP